MSAKFPRGGGGANPFSPIRLIGPSNRCQLESLKLVISEGGVVNLQVVSADNICKSGPTIRRTWSGSKLFDTLMVFLKEFFENVDFDGKKLR